MERTSARAGAGVLAESMARRRASREAMERVPGRRSRRKTAAANARLRLCRSRREARWATRASAASGRGRRGREARDLKDFHASSVRLNRRAERRSDSRAAVSSGVRVLPGEDREVDEGEGGGFCGPLVVRMAKMEGWRKE